MSGWVRIHRGWRDSEVFGSEAAFSEREAWLWLIEHAAWKPMVRTNAKGERIKIERGQLHLSLRQLEKVWGWGKNKVARFLDRLEKHDMISGTASGQSGHIVTLCNYAKYQDERDSRDSQSGTASGQSRDTQEEGKEIYSGSKEPSLEAKRATRIPENWMPAPLPVNVRALTDQWPPGRLGRELEGFRDYWTARSKDAARLDWDKTWHNRIRDQHDKVMRDSRNGRSDQNFGRGSPRPSTIASVLDREIARSSPPVDGYPTGGTGEGGGGPVARLAVMR